MATIQTSTALLIALAIASMVSSCKQPNPKGGSDTDVSSSTSTTMTLPTTGANVTTSASSSSSTSTSGLNISDSSVTESGSSDLPIADCDIWIDDCEPGLKCVAYTMRDHLDSTHCVPVAEDPKMSGEECSVSGVPDMPIDDCGIGLICWYYDRSGMGTCIPRCMGNPGDPVCPGAEDVCISTNQSGTNYLCIPRCDPISPVCPPRSICYVQGGVNDEFLCLPAASPIQESYGGSCSIADQCAAGLLCANSINVPGCQSPLCCTSFCDTDLPGTCPDDPVQECLKWPSPWPDWTDPPEHQDVGFCGVAE